MLRVVIVGLILVGGIVGGANASRLTLELQPVQQSPPEAAGCTFNIAHHSIASDGEDIYDASFLEAPTPALDIYENTTFNPPKDKLSQDSRTAGNMDSITSEIDGRGLIAPVESEISVDISEIAGEHNMTGKKVLGKLYEIIDGNDVLVGEYDCWNMHESGQKTYLTVKIGSSHRWVTSFNYNNIADFNNDEEVNLKDFAMLANDFGKPTGNYLTDISGVSGLSDGDVDEFDLKVFAENWLAEG